MKCGSAGGKEKLGVWKGGSGFFKSKLGVRELAERVKRVIFEGCALIF